MKEMLSTFLLALLSESKLQEYFIQTLGINQDVVAKKTSKEYGWMMFEIEPTIAWVVIDDVVVEQCAQPSSLTGNQETLLTKRICSICSNLNFHKDLGRMSVTVLKAAGSEVEPQQ